MRFGLLTFSLMVVLLSSCQSKKRSQSDVQAVTTTRPVWLKSPEAIEGTVTKAWGLSFTDEEKWRYIDAVYAVLGGTSVTEFSAILEQPNELFVMSIDNLSGLIAQKLLIVQKSSEQSATNYMFEGLGLSIDDSSSCFADDSKNWCDFKDGVTVNFLTNSNANIAALTTEQKKRLMHNIQDIGEFMLLAVDNTVTVPQADGIILPEYLLKEVFLKYLEEKQLTEETEQQAWLLVVHNILLSGAFFLETPIANLGAH